MTDGTLKHAEETTRRQLRAYIGHLGCPFEKIRTTRPPAPENYIYRAKYFDQNYGKTPAENVSMFIRILSGGVPPALDDELAEDCRQHVVQIVHPGQNVGRIIETDLATGLEDEFFFYGYVDYTDIFGHCWRHRFAFHHDPRLGGGRGERYVAHSAYNNEEYRGCDGRPEPAS